MKKLNLLLAAMMAFSLTCFVACSDDDDNTNNPDDPTEIPEGSDDRENPDEDLDGESTGEGNEDVVEGLYGEEELKAMKLQAADNILRSLAGVENAASSENETFEPTYGIVLDEANPYTRAYVCNSTEEAEALFRAIVGVSQLLVATADGYTINLNNIQIGQDGTKTSLGTLTFHRGDGTTKMGSIDVRISSIPHLISINYLPASAMPENGPNDSPYQLGDVIYLPKGNTYCSGYYMCIRQSVSGSGGLLVHLCEGDTGGDETINLDGDHDGCWYPYNNSKGMSTESGHIEAYISFLMTEKTIVDNVKFFLNGKIHDRKPSQSGKLSHIFPGGFGNDKGYVYKSDNNKGARIFYNAHYTDENYYWIFGGTYRRAYYWWVTNNCTSNTNWSKYITTHTCDYYKDSWWHDFIDGCNPFTLNVITFKNQTISGATIEYSPSSQNVTFENDAQFVRQDHLGWCYTSSNRLYETVSKARAAGQEPIGIVVYVNDGSEFGNRVTEKDGDNYGHGLVLALSNIAGNPSLRWNPSSGKLVDIDFEYTQWVDKNTGTKGALTDFDGLMKTQAMNFAGSQAANRAMNFQVPAPTPRTTPWFLPSAAQWIAMLCAPGLGGQPLPNENGGLPVYIEHDTKNAFANINNHMKGSGVYTIGASKYWSSSSYNGYTGIYVQGNGGTRLTWYNQSTTAKVRPILAF